MPIGATKRSYAYSSTGKMISNAKFSRKKNNEPFNTGDVIGVYLHLLACRPEFMRVGVLPRLIDSLVERESGSATVGQASRSLRIDSCQDVINSEDIKED